MEDSYVYEKGERIYMNRVTKNFMYNLLYHVFSLLTPLIVTPYITRVLSTDLIGVNAVVNAQASYFCIIGTLGITTLGVRTIASQNHGKFADEVNICFWKLYYTQLTMYSLAIISYFIFFLLMKQENKIIYSLYLFYIVSMMFDISWFYQGLENFRFIALRNIAIRVVSTLLIFIIVRRSEQIEAYIVCLYLPQLVLNVGMIITAVREFKLHLMKYEIDKNILKSSALLAIPTIAISVYTILDRIILGYYRPIRDVAVYDQGQVLIRIILSVMVAWSTAVLPRMSNAYSNEPEKVGKIIKNSASSMGFLAGGLFWGLIALNEPFIRIYLPDSFQYVIIILYICAPMILIVTIENLFGAQVLLPRKKDKEYTISLVCAAIVNCTLDLVFIPRYGIAAACISSVAAEFLAAVIQVYFCRKYIAVLIVLKDFFAQVLMGSCIIVVSAAVLYTVGASICGIACAVVCSAIVYIGFTFVFIQRKSRI